jgi:hypothetical protein
VIFFYSFADGRALTEMRQTSFKPVGSAAGPITQPWPTPLPFAFDHEIVRRRAEALDAQDTAEIRLQSPRLDQVRPNMPGTEVTCTDAHPAALVALSWRVLSADTEITRMYATTASISS